MDGFAGDACDYTVTVTQGNTDPPPLDPPGPITPTIIPCDQETVTFEVPPQAGAAYYVWFLPDSSRITTQVPYIDYTFGPTGQVCLQTNNVCNFSTPVCIDLEYYQPNEGTLTATPNPLCPGDTSALSVSGHNTGEDYTQVIIVTDANDLIIQITDDSSGIVSQDICGDFQVCTYNYVTVSGPVPQIGNHISSLDCDPECCKLTCSTVTFEDNETPTFPNPPLDVSYTCFDLLPAIEDQSWTDNCTGTGFVAGTETGSVDVCGGTITRTWEYTDTCGNFANHVQTITVDPAPAPSFINPPADINGRL